MYLKHIIEIIFNFEFEIIFKGLCQTVINNITPNNLSVSFHCCGKRHSFSFQQFKVITFNLTCSFVILLLFKNR